MVEVVDNTLQKEDYDKTIPSIPKIISRTHAFLNTNCYIHSFYKTYGFSFIY